MPEYIKKFDSNSDYYDFRETEEYTSPNVSYTIAEGEVFYTPVVHYAALLNGTTKVDESIIKFSLETMDGNKGYCSHYGGWIKLGTSNTFNKIELDMFRGAENVVVENGEYTELQFTYAMSGNKLTITSSGGSWNGSSLSNEDLKITYRCLGRNCETYIRINETLG